MRSYFLDFQRNRWPLGFLVLCWALGCVGCSHAADKDTASKPEVAHPTPDHLQSGATEKKSAPKHNPSQSLTEHQNHPGEKKDESPELDPNLKINLDHILRGGINRQGELVGMHHLPSAPNELQVNGVKCRVEIKQTSPGGIDDVVQAQVKLIDPETDKVVREKFSTLYPASWSEKDIIRAIHEAFADAEKNHKVDRDGHFDGHTKHGVRIDGYLSRDETMINTAFPVYSAHKTTEHDTHPNGK